MVNLFTHFLCLIYLLIDQYIVLISFRYKIKSVLLWSITFDDHYNYNETWLLYIYMCYSSLYKRVRVRVRDPLEINHEIDGKSFCKRSLYIGFSTVGNLVRESFKSS